MHKKVGEILDKSKEVLSECCLENGAIIAANTDHKSYPRDVQSYRYVWPRDASYICLALDILGNEEEQLNFFEWLIYRAEDLEGSGKLYQNYHTNGRKRWLAFQPDQQGSVLFAIKNFCKDDKKKMFLLKPLIVNLADGICKGWRHDHFRDLTQDLWEERFTYPELKMNHIYSIAVCIRGLEDACSMIYNERWKRVAEEMRCLIEKSYNGKYFMRTFGENNDTCLDASVIGLFYPFEIVGKDDERLLSTLKQIEKKIVKNNGVYRYEHDMYDSFSFQGFNARRGAGNWPILNLWLSIVFSKLGEKEKAKKYFEHVVNNVKEDNLIPEQFFENEKQVSVKPLAWSHAMFVIAARELGY